MDRQMDKKTDGRTDNGFQGVRYADNYFKYFSKYCFKYLMLEYSNPHLPHLPRARLGRVDLREQLEGQGRAQVVRCGYVIGTA